MFGFLKKNKSFTAKLVDYEKEFVVESGDSLLTGALKAGLSWPKKCQVGSCGTCKCKILDGKTRAEIDFSYVLSPEELSDGYALACQTSLKSDITVAVNLID